MALGFIFVDIRVLLGCHTNNNHFMAQLAEFIVFVKHYFVSLSEAPLQSVHPECRLNFDPEFLCTEKVQISRVNFGY